MTRITTVNTNGNDDDDDDDDNNNNNTIEVCVFFYMGPEFIFFINLEIWHSWYILQGSLKT
jgi:hypothetical protein